MKTLIVGCGNIGSAAAQDLAETAVSIDIVVADRDAARARDVAEKSARRNVSWTSIDVSNRKELTKSLKEFELIMGFLPGKLGYNFAQACIEAERDLVDVSYMAEDPIHLHDQAVRAGVSIVPDCGLAPGISNVLVGHAVAGLDKVETVHIMVGGLPEKPIPPLDYTITWSPESLIDEYTRKAAIIKKGKKTEIEALSGLTEIEFPKLGILEAFYTDGLRTLLHTIGGVEEMWEKTLRYPGHADKIKLLQCLGFFQDEKVDIENCKVSPRKLTAKLFEQKLWRPEIKDVVALKVEVSGVRDGENTHYAFSLADRYDDKRKMTAMARTTAYPMSIVAQLMIRKAIKQKGIVPPEKIGMDQKLFRHYLNGLESHGIMVKEKVMRG